MVSWYRPRWLLGRRRLTTGLYWYYKFGRLQRKCFGQIFWQKSEWIINRIKFLCYYWAAKIIALLIKQYRSDYPSDWASNVHPEASEAIEEVTHQLQLLFISQLIFQERNYNSKFYTKLKTKFKGLKNFEWGRFCPVGHYRLQILSRKAAQRRWREETRHCWIGWKRKCSRIAEELLPATFWIFEKYSLYLTYAGGGTSRWDTIHHFYADKPNRQIYILRSNSMKLTSKTRWKKVKIGLNFYLCSGPKCAQ